MPPLSQGARKALVHHLVESRRERDGDKVLRGHHNVNYVVRGGFLLALLLGVMPFARFKYRIPLKTIDVVPRIWPREADVLRVVCRHLREVPRFHADVGDGSLHRYHMGTALSELPGRRPHEGVDEELMRSFAAFFVRTAQVPTEALPSRPDDWPEDRDTQAFLDWLVDFTEEKVHRPNRKRFGTLFTALGIPEDGMACFRNNHRGLVSRPFRLLHTDVHRANVVVRGKRLRVIDWELAIFGDPLHDLATHVVRMGYDKQEQVRMTELWAEAMEGAGLHELTVGLYEDLPVYIAFEYAQSVFPDVMRAAVGLTENPDEEEFREAGGRISAAMGRAREPLGLVDVPRAECVVEALRTWHSAFGEQSRAAGAT